MTGGPPARRPAAPGVAPPRVSAVVAVLAFLAACPGHGGVGTSAPGPPTTNSFEWAGLRLEVRLLPSPPDRLRARGTLENVEDRHIEREVPYCVVMLRLYRDGRRIWSDGARSNCFGRRSVSLQPGEARTFDRTLRARRILGDSLPAGRYRVTAFWPGASRPGVIRAGREVGLGDVRLDPG